MYHSSHTAVKDLFHLEQSVSTSASPDNDSASNVSAQPDWRDSVKVPAISCPLNEADYHDLQALINPLDSNTDNMAIGLFIEVTNYVRGKLLPS